MTCRVCVRCAFKLNYDTLRQETYRQTKRRRLEQRQQRLERQLRRLKQRGGSREQTLPRTTRTRSGSGPFPSPHSIHAPSSEIVRLYSSRSSSGDASSTAAAEAFVVSSDSGSDATLAVGLAKSIRSGSRLQRSIQDVNAAETRHSARASPLNKPETPRACTEAVTPTPSRGCTSGRGCQQVVRLASTRRLPAGLGRSISRSVSRSISRSPGSSRGSYHGTRSTSRSSRSNARRDTGERDTDVARVSSCVRW